MPRAFPFCFHVNSRYLVENTQEMRRQGTNIMAVAPVSLSVRLLSTACFLGLLAAPVLAQAATPVTAPSRVVPGSAVPPGTNPPGLQADQAAGQGALVSILQASRP